MEPTEEQQQAIDAFATGESLAIRALAGSGKTSVLVLLAQQAEQTGRKGHYLSFNKSICADVGGRLGKNMGASTIHSLAWRAVLGPEPRFQQRSRAGRQPGSQIARTLGIREPIMVKTPTGDTKVLQPGWQAGHVMKAITKFCESADPTPTKRHFSYIDGIDVPGQWANNNEVAIALTRYLDKAWRDISSPTGTLPYRHDHYLKIWALDRPQIPVDFLLVDESQDLNGVQVGLFAAQQAQLVIVGDENQEIYGWRGAVSALSSIPTKHATFLTKSWRFGPAIAETANVLLDHLGSPIRVVGHDPIPSAVADLNNPKALLCRTNAQAVSSALAAQQLGRKVHLAGGASDVLGFARGAISLNEKGWSPHPDLQIFKTWGEVQDYVSLDSQGAELQQLVKLIDTYSAETVVQVCEGSVPENRADVIVSTTHKSKGKEWETVQIAADFPDPNNEKRPVDPEEWRLAYVAATRAQLTLDPTGIQAFLNPPAAVAA